MKTILSTLAAVTLLAEAANAASFESSNNRTKALPRTSNDDHSQALPRSSDDDFRQALPLTDATFPDVVIATP